MKIKIKLTLIKKDETKETKNYTWDTEKEGKFKIAPLERIEDVGAEDPRFIALSLETLPE